MTLHPFHSLCGYLGSFPPSLPRQLLGDWFSPGSLILDPFCGGGTTLLETTMMGYPSIGLDLNPLAVAISAAKTSSVGEDDVLHRLGELARHYPGSFDTSDESDAIRLIFHDRTLQQLKYLKDALGEDPEDVFLRGLILGIMHGKFRKDGTTAYLSIDMPNTFSMSPEYVRGFVQKNGLTKPPIDVFSKARERVRWLFRANELPAEPFRVVSQRDATQISGLAPTEFGWPDAETRIDGILTSPPYLGVLRYGAFNWIRLWFLGHEASQVDQALDSSNSLDRYLSFMLSFLLAAGEVLAKGSRTVLVVGDVVEGAKLSKLGEQVWHELRGLIPFKLLAIQEDEISSSDKRTRIWGEEHRGQATPLDRILVLERA